MCESPAHFSAHKEKKTTKLSLSRHCHHPCKPLSLHLKARQKISSQRKRHQPYTLPCSHSSQGTRTLSSIYCPCTHVSKGVLGSTNQAQIQSQRGGEGIFTKEEEPLGWKEEEGNKKGKRLSGPVFSLSLNEQTRSPSRTTHLRVLLGSYHPAVSIIAPTQDITKHLTNNGGEVATPAYVTDPSVCI